VSAIAAGIHSDLTREEYDAIAGRTNFSHLKMMARSPLHYKTAYRMDTSSMTLGRAVHLAVLEPSRYASAVAVWTGDRRAGKVWDAFRADNAGKELLTEEEDKAAKAIAASVMGNESARRHLTGEGTPETSILWKAGEHACKGRLDFDGPISLVDLKSTRDASPEGFGRQAHNLHYISQAAFYSDGYFAATGERKPFVLVAVEPESPFAVQVYRVTEAQIERGRAQYTEWLARLEFCRKNDFWPSYFDGEIDLCLPRWAEGAAS